MNITRQQSLELLKKHNADLGHIRHGYAVEACMRYFAEKEGEDPDFWGQVGLLHDLDWEETQSDPAQHCHRAMELLEQAGYPEEFRHAVSSHGWGICTDTEPRNRMELTLYTIDELTGLILTTALVRPSKSLQDLTAKSVKKKWKEKSFAAGVDRDLIQGGADKMGVELGALIDDVIAAMRPIEKELGLGQ